MGGEIDQFHEFAANNISCNVFSAQTFSYSGFSDLATKLPHDLFEVQRFGIVLLRWFDAEPIPFPIS